jgi:activator of 2-hydroxyglutaryl-CoA dehydratase
MADKTYTVIDKIKLEKACRICGEGVPNMGLIKIVEDVLRLKLLAHPQPHKVTAFKAAFFAKKAYEN